MNNPRISLSGSQVVEEFVVAAQAMLEQDTEAGERVQAAGEVTVNMIDSVMPEVPGVCFIRQLENISANTSLGEYTFIFNVFRALFKCTKSFISIWFLIFQECFF